MMIDIYELRQLNEPEKIAVTRHAKERLEERKIRIIDIINGIQTGKIIKQYEDDKPLPSCLVLGYTSDNAFIHIVVSKDDYYIYLITAYYPDPAKWKDGYSVRKE
ncbi:MAG: DUF4258 domain-containing protein [Clostridiales bacterium]|nr:DUF4258 domain-containing protein [Lachnospiraceae bacterium]MCD8110313.1 DUF4258 domain-containing protein [Clostridiales bacterium]